MGNTEDEGLIQYTSPQPRREAVSTEPVTLIYGRGFMEFEKACRILEIDHVHARYGDWVVTEYGLECLATYYAIQADRLFGEWTLRHMREKAWVVYPDFAEAYEAARQFHRQHDPARSKSRVAMVAKAEPATIPGSDRRPRRPSLSTRIRFIVLKRDGYACQLCGRSASQGALLHIDHKLARAKGGSDAIENLWTLCSLCNLGKGTEDL